MKESTNVSQQRVAHPEARMLAAESNIKPNF